ncbi:site-specific integrase [Emticicia sp.]|uniref:site-specific integrase n=1 Tax=Emticicia sp. TaxID=1930953 RepID=UPI003750937C
MASIRVILYTQKLLKNGEHPIVIQIIKDRKVKKMTVGSCLPTLWDFKLQLPKQKHPQYRELEILIEKKKSEAKTMLLSLENEKGDFSLEDFEKKFQAKNETKTVFAFLDLLIENLIKDKKIGNAKVYKDLKRILKRFRAGKDLNFTDINGDFLKKLEQDCRERDMTEVSISTYFRTLRALYNRAVSEKYAKMIDYPFSDFKVSKFSTKTVKRAINWEEIQKIINLSLSKESKLYDTQQLFIFSYFAWGINFADMAVLEWSDIKNNVLKYARAKNGRHYSIELIPEAIRINEHYKQYRSDDYIFPILFKKRHQTPIAVHNRIKKVNRQINDNLKKIAEMVGIDNDITFYVARHTFATVLKRKGLATSVIQEMMGHDSEKTTQIYLDDFENKVLYDASKLLVG